jgi:hypothetical protein
MIAHITQDFKPQILGFEPVLASHTQTRPATSPKNAEIINLFFALDCAIEKSKEIKYFSL